MWVVGSCGKPRVKREALLTNSSDPRVESRAAQRVSGEGLPGLFSSKHRQLRKPCVASEVGCASRHLKAA